MTNHFGKVLSLGLLIVTINTITSTAQIANFNFKTVKDVYLSSPKLIGASNGHYQILDFSSNAQSKLYVLDTNLNVISTRDLPYQAYTGYQKRMGDTTMILWNSASIDSMYLTMLKLDVQGEELRQQKWAFSTKEHPAFRFTSVDENGRFVFYYALYQDSTDKVLVNGVLVDQQTENVKSLSYSVDFDEALQRFKMPLVDVKGNIHVAVYDKLTNYRLAATVQLYTIPSKERSLLTETFSFDKVKFYDLEFADNTYTNEIQLRGFYYDGLTKVKTGLASVGFPYDRINKISNHFTPVVDLQKFYLMEGVSYYNKRFEPLDYLKVRSIQQQKGNTLLNTWVINMPYKQFVKDREAEYPNNMLPPRWLTINNEKEAKAIRAAKPSLRNDALKNQSQNSFFSTNTTTTASFGPLNGVVPPTIQKPAVKEPKQFAGDDISLTSALKVSKIGFFLINEKGEYEWLQVTQSASLYQQLLNENAFSNRVFLHKNNAYFITASSPQLKADNSTTSKDQEQPVFTLTQMSKNGILEQALPLQLENQWTSFSFTEMNSGQYLAFVNDRATRKTHVIKMELLKK